MPEQWFVRVEGREYGPVELSTLREWHREGRLIPTNEVRRVGDAEWKSAAELTELFAPPTVAAAREPDPLFRARTIAQIFGESFVIYARGFWQFFALSLLIAVPGLVRQISSGFVQMQKIGVLPRESLLPAALTIVATVFVLVAWPIFVGALQFATADLVAGRPVRLGDLLRRASNLWPRIAKLSLFVYGSYLFWTAFLFIMVGFAVGAPSVLSIFFALIALAVQIYMVGRLFVNFLFWQQSATIGGLDGAEALRDSRELARSRPTAPLLERPLYRGAILASIWLVVLLAAAFAVEFPFMLFRLRGITTIDEVMNLAQQLRDASTPDALAIGSSILSAVVRALIRPVVGISFVLLYFDAKSRL